jgi:choline dehydrogenase-like flavoprotein
VSPDIRHTADVAIVGGGLVGSVLARWLAAGGARVAVLDAGSPASVVPGTHLRNVPACRADRSFYYDLVRAHLRPASVPQPTGSPLGPEVPPMPEGHGLNAEQRADRNMPAARVTNVLGGMGALWNCVTPRLDASLEPWPGISPPEWDALYARAEEALGVSLEASAGSRRQEALLRALAERYPSVRPAPLAGRRSPDGPVRWTGPAEIMGEGVELLPQHAVRRLRQRGGRVTEAEAVALDSGEVATIAAETFVVAAGGIRTPALLAASRISGDALGRYLYDHPVAYAQLVLNPELLPGRLDGDPDPFVIVPLGESRPFHALLLCDAYDAGVLEGRVDDTLLVGLYWYTLMEPRFENRIVFSGRSTDSVGLPQPTFEYALSQADRERLRDALEDLRAAGRLLGTFLPTSPPQIRSAGSSMHIMGTTRMGEADDGHSVVDPTGRVWGFENLYLGGTGVVPCPTASNPTLAVCAVAARTADRILGR